MSTIALAKTAPASVLASQPVPYTLTATNPANAANAAPQYNVSFRGVLAPGVTYQPGSTTPADIGDPKVISAQVEFPPDSGTLVPQQTLIWSNVADLPIGSSVVLNYRVHPDSSTYPVGSTVGNSAKDFASIRPRLVPRFTAAGVPIDSPFIAVGPVRANLDRVVADHHCQVRRRQPGRQTAARRARQRLYLETCVILIDNVLSMPLLLGLS